MKKILKRTGKVFCLFLLIVVLVNVLSPLFCRKPDEKYVESLRETEFTSETEGTERICCIDDNEEALLWRLRMIGTAKESIVPVSYTHLVTLDRELFCGESLVYFTSGAGSFRFLRLQA